MKKIITLSVTLAMIIIMLLSVFTSASEVVYKSAAVDDLVGTWRRDIKDAADINVTTWEFDEEGNFVFTNRMGDSIGVASGKYELEDGVASLTYLSEKKYGMQSVSLVEINGDLVLKDDVDSYYTYYDVDLETEEPAEGVSVDDIIGVWRDEIVFPEAEIEAEYYFDQDGDYTYTSRINDRIASMSGTYELDDATLVLHYESGDEFDSYAMELECVYLEGEFMLKQKYDYFFHVADEGESALEEVNESETALEEEVSAQEETEASDRPEYDFKKFHWGDSKEDIIAVEGEPMSEDRMDAVDATYLVYNSSVVGKDALLVYYFCDEGFYEARYILTEKHTQESLYIDDYNAIKKELTKKYGEPLIDHENWLNDSKKEYYKDDKGNALSYGYLSYWTWYLKDYIDVSMDMSADNFNISTVIYFSSLTLGPGEPDYSDDF